MATQNRVCVRTQLDKLLKVLAVLAAHHVDKIGCQHEGGALAFDAEFALDIAQKVAKINI